MRLLKANLHVLAVAAVLAGLWLAVRLPRTVDSGLAQEARTLRFALERKHCAEPGRKDVRSRPVNPALSNIAPWVCSTLASAAFADFDGDGLYSDLVYTDPRLSGGIVIEPQSDSARRMLVEPCDRDGIALADAATCAPSQVLPGDFNADGRMDLAVGYWGRPPILLLQRGAPGELSDFEAVPLQPNPTLADEAEDTRADLRWFTDALTSADLDGDGFADLIVGNYFADGAAVLDERSRRAVEMQSSMSRAYNGGGKHFFLARPRAAQCFVEAPVELHDAVGRALRSRQDVLHGWTLALAAADLSGDGLPELFIGNDFGPDRLLLNESTPGRLRFRLLSGRRDWTTPQSKTFGRDSFKTMGAEFAYLGTGVPGAAQDSAQLALLTSNIAADWALMENHGAYLPQARSGWPALGWSYHDFSERLGLDRGGWGWDVKAVDCDNNGRAEIWRAVNFVRGSRNYWPRLHEIAESNDWWLQEARHWPPMDAATDISGWSRLPVQAWTGRRFADVAGQAEYEAFDPALQGEPRMIPASFASKPTPGGMLGELSFVTRGIAVTDLEGDGLADLCFANQWEDSVLLRNRSQAQLPALGLRIVFDAAAESGAPRALEGLRRERPQRLLPAIGAYVELRDGQGRVLGQGQVDGGNGHSGKRAPIVLLPYPAADAAGLRVFLRWRSGTLHEAEIVLPPAAGTLPQCRWFDIKLPWPEEAAHAH